MSKIQCIDKMLEKCEYTNALSVLKELAQEYPSEGIVPYYLGQMSLIGKDNLLAQKYFKTAIDMGYEKPDAYLLLALIQKDLYMVAESEENFTKAVNAAHSSEILWTVLSCSCVFYIENEMFLKAEKIAKRIIKEYPENYEGHHLHIMINALRERYEEVFAYMDILPEKFKIHPQFLIDIIEIYKKSGKESKLLELFDRDLRFNAIIPQVVLRERISTMENVQSDDTKEQLIRELANEYHNKDAIISVMILEFSKKNFKKSSQIANAILDNEKGNQGFRYYLALYFQIYNLYYLAERKPSVELRKWIEKAGNWCINFVDEMGIPAASDVVTSSIQELFDEINDNDSE